MSAERGKQKRAHRRPSTPSACRRPQLGRSRDPPPVSAHSSQPADPSIAAPRPSAAAPALKVAAASDRAPAAFLTTASSHGNAGLQQPRAARLLPAAGPVCGQAGHAGGPDRGRGRQHAAAAHARQRRGRGAAAERGAAGAAASGGAPRCDHACRLCLPLVLGRCVGRLNRCLH